MIIPRFVFATSDAFDGDNIIMLKAAGALGLMIGIWIPWIGIAAGAGLVLFFVGAIVTHLRAHDYSFGLALVFLSLAVAALILRAVTL